MLQKLIAYKYPRRYNYFMNWFNYYGLIIVAIMMILNIVYAIVFKDNNDIKYNNKIAVILEQIGRYAWNDVVVR